MSPDFSDSIPKVRAPVGQAEEQAGVPPAIREVLQRLHLTIVLFSGSNFGASYGQFHWQYLQPMHFFQSSNTAPVMSSLLYADEGQPSMQIADSQ